VKIPHYSDEEIRMMNDAWKRAQKAHESCKDVILTVRTSFDIWDTLTYNHVYSEIYFYDPFTAATIDAHFLSVFNGLHILGYNDGSGNNQSVRFLVQKLADAKVIEEEDKSEYDSELDLLIGFHKKIDGWRSKYFCHRDKRYDYQKILSDFHITNQELETCVSKYYNLISAISIKHFVRSGLPLQPDEYCREKTVQSVKEVVKVLTDSYPTILARRKERDGFI
jgi:hypothetical protein